MSDLISRSALIKYLTIDGYIPKAIKEAIELQPTAYDVDKVVAELEEERMRYFLTIANTGDASLDIAYKEVSDVIEKAIDIVKRGGVANV